MKSLGVVVGLAALVFMLAMTSQQPVKALPKTAFPLKSVEISGQDGQFVADAIRAQFLEDGAVIKTDGVAITGNVEWMTINGSKVVGIKVNCRGIKVDGLSVSAAAVIDSPVLRAQRSTNQGTYVQHAANKIVDDFRRQVLQQQSYLPQVEAPVQLLR